MRNFKKITSIILCIILCFSAMSTIAFANNTDTTGDYTFTLSGTNAIITGYYGSATDVVIPEKVEMDGVSYPVVKVDANVFSSTAVGNGANVTSIVFPSTMKWTGGSVCRNNTNLVSVTINGTDVELSNYFVSGCSNLEAFTINGSVKLLGIGAIHNTKLTSIEFPEGLVTLNDFSLYNYNLKTIKLPSSVTTFNGNEILRADRVSNITIYVPDTATEAKVRTGIQYKNNDVLTPFLNKMIVGDGYESNPGLWPGYPVNDGAAFATFNYTGTAQKVAVPALSYLGTPINTFAANDTMKQNTVVKSLLIPEAITVFSNNVLNGNSTVENLVINSDITGSLVWQGMQGLKSVVITGDVTVKDVFKSSTLETAVINSNITVAGIFNSCTALADLTVNGDINVNNALNGMTALKKVTVNGTINNSYAFAGDAKLEEAVVTNISDGVENTFHGNTLLRKITIKGTVAGTESKCTIAHSTCTALEEIEIAETGKLLDDGNKKGYTFAQVRNIIKKVTIKGTVEQGYAFKNSTSITDVYIANTAKITASSVFFNCTALTNVEFEEGVTIDGGATFQQCTALKSVLIPRNVTFKDWGTFSSCSALETVDIRKGCNLGVNSFVFSTNVKNIIIRDGAIKCHFGFLYKGSEHKGIVTYYMSEWYEGLNLQDPANRTRTCYVDNDVVLTYDEEFSTQYLRPSKEGYIFYDFVCYPTDEEGNSLGEQIYDREQGQNVRAFNPKFLAPIVGDTNGDGKLSVLDFIRYKKYIGDNTAPFISYFADVNSDGDINGDDLVIVKHLLLGTSKIAADYAEKYGYSEAVFEAGGVAMWTNPGEYATATLQAFEEENGYHHHPHLTKFNDVWYVMYSEGTTNEDALGQHIMYVTSKDFVNWSEPMELTLADAETMQWPLSFYNDGENLFAYYSVNTLDNGKVASSAYYYKKLNADGEWDEAVLSENSLGGYETAVKAANGYYYIPTSTGIRGSKNGTDWFYYGLTSSQIKSAVERGAESLSEGTLYFTDDGAMHLLMRGGDGYIWHTFSVDYGRTWFDAYRTELVCGDSKFQIGKLDDGRYYIVCNTDVERSKLYIYISNDGYTFASSYVIRGITADGANEEYVVQKEGNAKGGMYAYPSTYCENGIFYVVYSCGKEIIEATSFPISYLVS